MGTKTNLRVLGKHCLSSEDAESSPAKAEAFDI